MKKSTEFKERSVQLIFVYNKNIQQLWYIIKQSMLYVIVSEQE
jgi:hypothetical protein